MNVVTTKMAKVKQFCMSFHLHTCWTARPRAQIPCQISKYYKSWAQCPLTFHISHSLKNTRVHTYTTKKVRPTHVPHYLPQKCDLYPTPEGGYFNLKKEGVHLMEFHVSVATQWQWGFEAPPTRQIDLIATAPASVVTERYSPGLLFAAQSNTAHSPMPGLW